MEEIKRLQIEILKIFNEFKKICFKHNLKYYAIGGTCLGAVRHKGFIPWDDDIDIVMPIKDYFKFIQISEKMLPTNLKIVKDTDRKDVLKNGFIKLTNINTTYIEKKFYENRTFENFTGAFIDIMPMIGSPKNILRKGQIAKFYILKKLDTIRNIKINRYNNTLKSRILHIILKPILLVFRKEYFYDLWIKNLCKYDIEKRNDILFPFRIPLRKPYSNIFPYDFFGDGVELPFENIKINCPTKYKEYLGKDFGDYTKLPPEGDRIPKHTAIIDLNKSYFQYIDEMKKEEKNEK